MKRGKNLTHDTKWTVSYASCSFLGGETLSISTLIWPTLNVCFHYVPKHLSSLLERARQYCSHLLCVTVKYLKHGYCG